MQLLLTQCGCRTRRHFYWETLIAGAPVSSFGNCNLEGTAREMLMIILSLNAHASDRIISSYDTVALFDPFRALSAQQFFQAVTWKWTSRHDISIEEEVRLCRHLDALCNCIKKRLITLRYLISCSMTWMRISWCTYTLLLIVSQPVIMSVAIFNRARIFQSLSPLIVDICAIIGDFYLKTCPGSGKHVFHEEFYFQMFRALLNIYHLTVFIKLFPYLPLMQ